MKHDLITSPAFITIKAANEFHDKTVRPNQLWQTDFTYQADQNFVGGGIASSNGPLEINGTDDDTLYQTERWGQDGFKYEVAVDNGAYYIELNFAELLQTAANGRVFDVKIEGQTVLDDLDLVDDVGSATAFNAQKNRKRRRWFALNRV